MLTIMDYKVIEIKLLLAGVLRMLETKLLTALKRETETITTIITMTIINLIPTLKRELKICFVNPQGFVFKKIVTQQKIQK
jgi:hypothetical protein